MVVASPIRLSLRVCGGLADAVNDLIEMRMVLGGGDFTLHAMSLFSEYQAIIIILANLKLNFKFA